VTPGLDLLTDDDRRRAMGEAARRHALVHATLDRAVGMYRELYDSVREPQPLNVLRHEDAVAVANLVMPQPRQASVDEPLAGASR
jgi:hypothetical protein